MFSFLFKKKKIDGDGERVDINYFKMRYKTFDQYQKSHYHRYQFAKEKLNPNDQVGDFACGTGYGSMILAERCKKVTGVDLNQEVIEFIQNRYRKQPKVEFIHSDLLDLKFENSFDKIISFETVEHLSEENIEVLFEIYHKALKEGGKLIFSTPYNQEKSEIAIKMGFHLTFYILEDTVRNWLEKAGFELDQFYYQNYFAHDVVEQLDFKEFIITVARKK
jgi:cyclopropane fatty-acyl-phospholipid synthase-like methyltransferase